jgi:hypothetical protein
MRLLSLGTTITVFAGTALALPSASKQAQKRDIIFSGAAVNGQTFDYVIAGGGLAGMVLAGRLSEDSNRRILVIEAGYDEEGRSTVTGKSCILGHPKKFLLQPIPSHALQIQASINRNSTPGETGNTKPYPNPTRTIK